MGRASVCGWRLVIGVGRVRLRVGLCLPAVEGFRFVIVLIPLSLRRLNVKMVHDGMLLCYIEGRDSECDTMFTVRFYPGAFFVRFRFISVDGGRVVTFVGPIYFRFDRHRLVVKRVDFSGDLYDLERLICLGEFIVVHPCRYLRHGWTRWRWWCLFRGHRFFCLILRSIF